MDRVYLNRPSICEVLKAKIQKFKREHPRLNSSQIARQFDIATSTFNRIENLDIKNPSIDQSIKILNGVGCSEDVADFLREYYPELHNNMVRHYSEIFQKKKEEECFQQYFEDETTFKMILKATSRCGLKENDVLQELGRQGHKIFMKLASRGILKNINGSFYASNDETYVKDRYSLKISELLYKELYELSKFENKSSYYLANIGYESVDYSKVSKELKNLYDEFNRKVVKVLKNPKNRGDDIIVHSNLLRKLD